MTQNNLFEGDDIYDFDYLTEDRSEPSRPKIRHRDTLEVPNNKVRLPPVLVGRNVAAMNEAKMAKMAERAMTRTVIKAESQDIDWHKERLKLKGPRQPMKEVRTCDTKVPWNKTRLPHIPEVAEPKPTPRRYEDSAVSRIRPLQDQIQLNMTSVKSGNDSLLPSIFNDKPQKVAKERKFPDAATMDKIDFPSEETPYEHLKTVAPNEWQHGNSLDKMTTGKPPMPPSAIKPTNDDASYSKRRRKLRYIADADIYNEPEMSRNEKSILAPIPPSDPMKTPMDESTFTERRPLRVRFATNTELNQDVSVHKESRPFYRPRPNTPYEINYDEEVRMCGNAKYVLAPIPTSDPLKTPMDEPTFAERRPLRVRFAANTELNQDVSFHKESKPFYRPRPNTPYEIDYDEEVRKATDLAREREKEREALRVREVKKEREVHRIRKQEEAAAREEVRKANTSYEIDYDGEVRMSGIAKSILAPISPSDPLTPMDEPTFAERRPLRVRFAINTGLNQDVSVHKESKPFYRPRPNTPYDIDYDDEVRKATDLAIELEKEREVHRARELEKERQVHRKMRQEEAAAREVVKRAKAVDGKLEKKKEEPRRISREEAIARYGVEYIEDLMYGVKYPEAPPLPHPANIGKASVRGYPSDSAISVQNQARRPHEVSWSGEHARRGAGFVSNVKQQNQPKSNSVTNTQIPEKIRKQMRRYFH